MKSNTKSLVYEISFAVLALIAIISAFADILDKIPAQYFNTYLIIDNIILAIFAIDYVYRFIKAEDKKQFVRSNIPDLVSIIPFNSLFRAFRFVRLLRVLKLLRLFAFSGRFYSKARRFLNTNGFINILYFTMASILTGSVLIYIVERGKTVDTFADAIWWSFVTTTTVGYGDISPETGTGRIIAAVLMIIGIGFVGMLTATIATFFLSKINIKDETDTSKILDLSDLSDNDFETLKKFSEFLKRNV